jgi:hypothetical protein
MPDIGPAPMRQAFQRARDFLNVQVDTDEQEAALRQG